LEIAAIGKLLLAICIFSSRRKSQRFTNYISRKRIFETNPQLFILLLPISRLQFAAEIAAFRKLLHIFETNPQMFASNFANELRANLGFDKFVFMRV
jgi:hypothetical protein